MSTQISQYMAAVGYHADRATAQAVSALLSQRGGGARALLVTGAPGTGKTALAEAIARAHGAPIHFKSLGRMIGNAVPVTLGRIIGRSILRHLAG